MALDVNVVAAAVSARAGTIAVVVLVLGPTLEVVVGMKAGPNYGGTHGLVTK